MGPLPVTVPEEEFGRLMNSSHGPSLLPLDELQ